VDFEQSGLGVAERETGVVVVDDALESLYDAAEKFGDFATGDEDIVDFEENLEAIALASELRLIGLGSLKIKGIIDGNGYLAGDALHELEFGVGDALGDEAAEAHGAEAMLGSGERKNGDRANIVRTIARQEIGEARFFFGVADDEGLLRLPDPAGGVAFDGRFGAGDFFAGDTSFENVEAHDVFCGVVKDEREEVEVDDGVEAAGKVVEKRGEIALLGDSLADFEQGFELTPGMFKRGGERHFRRGDDGFRHRNRITSGLAGAQPQAVAFRGWCLVSRYLRTTHCSAVSGGLDLGRKPALALEMVARPALIRSNSPIRLLTSDARMLAARVCDGVSERVVLPCPLYEVTVASTASTKFTGTVIVTKDTASKITGRAWRMASAIAFSAASLNASAVESSSW